MGTRKQFVANTALILFSILIPFGLTELFLRFYFRKSMDLNMEMFKYSSQNKVPSKKLLPGHLHKPTSNSFLMGSSVSINSVGMRDEKDPYNRDDDSFRIALVGDSFVFGWGVDSSHTFSELIQSKLNSSGICPSKIEVYNFGVGNYNTLQELALYESLAPIVQPNMTLLVHFINDAEPFKKNTPNFIQRHSYTYNFFAARIKTKHVGSYSDFYANLYSDPDWNGNKSALIKLSEIVESTTGNPLVVFALPELRQLKDTSELSRVYSQRLKFLESTGIPYYDLRPPLLSKFGDNPASSFVTPEDSHSNKTANLLIASYIVNSISEPVEIACHAKTYLN